MIFYPTIDIGLLQRHSCEFLKVFILINIRTMFSLRFFDRIYPYQVAEEYGNGSNNILKSE